MGVQPDVLAQHLTENNQIPAIVSEVLRSKALNLVVEHVKATDDKGNDVDVAAMLQHEAGGDEEGGDQEAGETPEAEEDKADA
jgi:hypothetical protein